MKHTLAILLTALLLAPIAALQAADTFLVANGQPRAEILIAEKPTRMQELAAEERPPRERQGRELRELI